MTITAPMTVFLRDEKSRVEIPQKKWVHIIRKVSQARVPERTNLFIVTSASELAEVAKVVHGAKRGQLRGFFIRTDVDLSWLGATLADAEIRALRNIVVHSGADVPDRILRAWSIGAERALIADARVEGRDLIVRDCTLKQYRVQLKDIPALARLSLEGLTKLQVSRSGSHIRWEDYDVDLDLDSIRYATDEDFRAVADAVKVAYDQRFGSAVAEVRKRHGLRQADVEGLSARQLSRIERGGGGIPRMETLRALASAHRMSVEDYVSEISGAIASGDVVSNDG